MEGAVAAPTAGLHFTANVFERLKAKNIHHDFVTLHVSAGTFMPVKTERVSEHVMHEEQIIVTKENIQNMLEHPFIVPKRLIVMVHFIKEEIDFLMVKNLLYPTECHSANKPVSVARKPPCKCSHA